MSKGYFRSCQGRSGSVTKDAVSLPFLLFPGRAWFTVRSARISSRQRPDWFCRQTDRGACTTKQAPHALKTVSLPLVSTFAVVHCRSRNVGMCRSLLPRLTTWREGGNYKNLYDDRFGARSIRACIYGGVTSHLKRDGHYVIHPTHPVPSSSARKRAHSDVSLTINFFCGPRTRSLEQVGTAVPPLVAEQIAEIVWQAITGR